MSETLIIAGVAFESVAGFKAVDSSLVTQTYIKPEGTAQISISSNGSITEDITTYASAQINVAVPNTYSAGDEGKVVSSGELVAQGNATYSSNGTYDTTLVSSIDIEVPGVEPSGTIAINSNGVYDVAAYASASVDIASDSLYFTSRMIPYQKNMTIPSIFMGANPGVMYNAKNLENVVCNDNRVLGGSNANRVNEYFRYCTSLKTFSMPFVQGFLSNYTNYFLGGCTALQEATFGSIGHAVTQFAPTSANDRIFNGDTQATLIITIFVEASSLADVPTEIKTYAPWGATKATIIYKSSVDGSVLT